ncbi:MAG: DUF4340 domain-containing protein [Anaerolineae bacterium]|jgi:hypothetical protein|nr:DUF4340 domain-containing protein [Anaerolineae bacterium]
MRLDRNTIILIVISLVVIVGVLVINNSQINAPPQVTPTVDTQSGQLLTVNPADLRQLEIRNNETLAFLTLRRVPSTNATVIIQPESTADVTPEVTPEATPEMTPESTPDPMAFLTPTADPNVLVWIISQGTNLQNRTTDTLQAENAVLVFSALRRTNFFTTDNPANFGLDTPRFTIIATAAGGETYQVDVGLKNPTAPRYYVTLNGDKTTVYQVAQDQIDSMLNLIVTPPYSQPSPTPFLTATPNPFSEVEQTATAIVIQTQTASAPTITPLPSATPTVDATAEVTPETTPEATDAVTPEVTP